LLLEGAPENAPPPLPFYFLDEEFALFVVPLFGLLGEALLEALLVEALPFLFERLLFFLGPGRPPLCADGFILAADPNQRSVKASRLLESPEGQRLGL
jgi:hypothetical protein